MKKLVLFVVIGVLCAFIFAAAGCDTTQDADTPPNDQNGQDDDKKEPDTRFTRQDFDLESDIVPSPVDCAVLLPPCYEEGDDYPLLLTLHGGQGSRAVIETYHFPIREAIKDGKVPPMVLASLTVTPLSAYMDFADGSELWETFIIEEFIPHLRKTFKISSETEKTMVTGVSMGGQGALRLAFKHPDVFGVTAAFAPRIRPVFKFADLMDRHQYLLRSDEQLKMAYGDPFDHDYYNANNPATIARDNAEKIRESGLKIFIEAGDEDVFLLHEGTEFLQRVLFDVGIRHEYHYYMWIDHSSELALRMQTLFQFLGRALDPPGPADRIQMIVDLREAVGIPPDRWVPPVLNE